MRVSVGDLELFVEAAGEGPPFVIGLHGGPGLDGSKLRYQLAPVAESAQVVVPDQRGHGRSDRGGPETWNLDAWAADVKSLAEALEIARPVVLGVSFGGFVAQRYAAMYPGHPAALILISTSPVSRDGRRLPNASVTSAVSRRSRSSTAPGTRRTSRRKPTGGG